MAATNRSETVTEEVESWIREHGSARDALNVALAKLRLCNDELDRALATIRKQEDDLIDSIYEL